MLNFEKKLDFYFLKKEYLRQALTHSSYAHENSKDRVSHNERLEFLGDAVLELIISEHLYINNSDLPEGELTRLRSIIVCEQSLFTIAKNLELGSYILLGKGEMAGGGQKRPSILADCLEALIGAIYLDRGYDVARFKVLELFQPVIDAIKEGTVFKDYKTMIQEYSQSKYALTPEYRIVRETGPDHDKVFVAQMLLENNVMGEGKGKNKKEAEQAAACNAWDKLRG